MILTFLKYELKKSIWPTLILTILGSLVYIPVIINSSFSTNSGGIIPNPQVNTIIIILCVLCSFIPIYEFSFLMKKRTVDQYYSFPIKRINIILLKFVSGFLKIFTVYSVNFFLGFFIILSKPNSYFLEYFIQLYIYSIILGLFLYAFFSFVFSRANSVIDGILFIILYIFLLTIILLNINKLNIEYHIFAHRFIFIGYDYPYSPLLNLLDYYELLLMGSKTVIISWTSYIIWSVVGVVSIVGLLLSTKIDKAERAEQISDSYFGYRILIPLYIILIGNMIDTHIFSTDFFVYYSLILGLAIILLIIYRRNFKLSLKYWLIILISIIITILPF